MEIWKPFDVPGYTGVLEVSNTGRVRRSGYWYDAINKAGNPINGKKPDKLLSPYVELHGYRSLTVYVGRKRKRFLVHRLVAFAFVEGHFEGATVNHINGNKLDNRAENLEWVTLAENTSKQWATGLVNLRGENQPGSKLTESDVRRIRLEAAEGRKHTHIAKDLGVCNSLIGFIVQRKRWAWVE